MDLDQYCSDSLSPPHPRKIKSNRPKTLTELESVRLSSLNSRTTCLAFHSMRQLPSSQDLLCICPSHPAQSVVVGPDRRLWCFLVFPTALDKERAEKYLDCSDYKGGHVTVDLSKRLVPIVEADLEQSRELTSLAVHGISAGTSKRDLETAFPSALSVTIARRGGSAFLRFEEREETEREFRRSQRAVVGGWRVEVMFGHSLQGPRKRKGVVGDLREKIRGKMGMRDVGRVAEYWGGRSSKSDQGDSRWRETDRARSRSRSGRPRSSGSRNEQRSDLKSSSRSSGSGRGVKLIRRSKFKSYIDHVERGERRNKMEVGKMLLSPVSTSSPCNSIVDNMEVLTPPDSNEKKSASISLSPSPISRKSSPIRSMGDCSSVQHNKGGEDFGPLYRVLVTQLVGVGLSAKLAHGRAADIVNVWAETGYKVDELREVVRESSGVDQQRKELSRIVKKRCRRMARKMNIDIGAMVDITIAYLLESVSQDVSNNNNCVPNYEHKELGRYLEKELASLGMKRKSVEQEVTRVVETLSKLNLGQGQMEADYISMVGDSLMGGQTEFHKSLEKKLADRGFISKYLSARLAAGLILEFYQGNKGMGKVVKHNKEVFVNMDNILSDMDDFTAKAGAHTDPSSSIPPGYSRMVIGFAFRLSQTCRMSEDECKVLARAMVGVWVNYGFDYMEISDIYEREKIGKDNEKDNLSLMDMRKLLHCRLGAKVDQGFSKPKGFGFSKLIDLTIFHFENRS